MAAPAFSAMGASIPAWSAGIQHEKNKRENKRAREWELHMWNLQNEYNTPLNIRKRMEAGGVNPMLAFGGNMVQATTAGSSTPHQGAQMTGLPEAVASGIGMVQNSFMQAEQIKQMEKQNKLIDAQVGNTYTQQFKTALEGAKTAQDYEFAKDAWRDNLRNIKANADIATTTADNTDSMQKTDIAQKRAQTQQVLEATKWIPKEKAAQVANMEADLQNKLITNKNLNETQIGVILKIQSEIDNLKANTKKTNVEKLIKEWEQRLTKAGLTPNDMTILRQGEMIGNQLDKK